MGFHRIAAFLVVFVPVSAGLRISRVHNFQHSLIATEKAWNCSCHVDQNSMVLIRRGNVTQQYRCFFSQRIALPYIVWNEAALAESPKQLVEFLGLLFILQMDIKRTS